MFLKNSRIINLYKRWRIWYLERYYLCLMGSNWTVSKHGRASLKEETTLLSEGLIILKTNCQSGSLYTLENKVLTH